MSEPCCECRERYEQAELYSNQLQEAAAQQMQLHSSMDKTSAAAQALDANTKGQLSKASPDVIRGAVKEQAAKHSGGVHQKHHQDAPKQQPGAHMHSRPQGAVSKQDVTVSSRGHSMTDVGTEDENASKRTEPGCAAVPLTGDLRFPIG